MTAPPSSAGAPAPFRLQQGSARGRLGLRRRAGRVPRGHTRMAGRADGACCQLRRALLRRVGHRGGQRKLPHHDWRDGPRRCSANRAIHVQLARLAHVPLPRLLGLSKRPGMVRHGAARARRARGAAGGAGQRVGLRQRGAARTGADGDGPAAAGADCGTRTHGGHKDRDTSMRTSKHMHTELTREHCDTDILVAVTCTGTQTRRSVSVCLCCVPVHANRTHTVTHTLTHTRMRATRTGTHARANTQYSTPHHQPTPPTEYATNMQSH